ANTVAWSRDGTYLLFDSRQRTEDGQLARVDLTLRTPKFREDLFRDLFADPKKPSTPGPPAVETPQAPSTSRGPASSPSAGPEPRTPEPQNPRTSPVFEDI